MGKITLDKAVELIKSGTPVALPTETVYGLACPIDNPVALKRVFKIKKRPLKDPLIVHASNIQMALELFEAPCESIKILAKVFWPGPLTLVGKKNKALVSDLITSNLDSVAVRIPASKVFREVIEKVGTPLAAPSANRFKKISPTSADHVLNTLPEVKVLDGGSSDVGIESTILDVANLNILRPGHITHKDIENIIKQKISYKEQRHTPGFEENHYQPNTPVYVFNSKESLTNFTNENKFVELSLSESSKTASTHFYKNLRELDGKAPYIVIYYNPNWNTEDWFGLKNRILKSSKKWTN